MPTTLGGLPPELIHMILRLLGPDEILRIHSTSRLWRNISEPRYSMFFFENLLVFVDAQGLERLEAISQNECRKRVRKIAFSLCEPLSDPMTEASKASIGSGSPESLSCVQRYPGASNAAAAAAIVRRAMTGFGNCTYISVEPKLESLWTASSQDKDFGQIFDFYNRGFRRSAETLPVSEQHKVLVLQTALMAAAASTHIDEFSIEPGHELTSNGIDLGTYWALNKSRLSCLNHIRRLQIYTDTTLSSGIEPGLRLVLDLFISIKTLDISFIEGRQDVHGMSMSMFLIEGIQSLYLDCIQCVRGDFLGLVQDPRARSIRRLDLSCFDITGGLSVWVDVMTAVCRNLELDELRLSMCFSDDIPLADLDVRRRRRISRRRDDPMDDNYFIYHNLNRSTVDRVIREFKKDLRE